MFGPSLWPPGWPSPRCCPHCPRITSPPPRGIAALALQPWHSAPGRPGLPCARTAPFDVVPGGMAGGICEGAGEVSGGPRRDAWGWRWPLHAGGAPVWFGDARLGIERVRAISTGRLRGLPRFHFRPIDVVVFHGSRRDLVLRGASRLDAFSGYPVRT